jgi:hypothetical protein
MKVKNRDNPFGANLPLEIDVRRKKKLLIIVSLTSANLTVNQLFGKVRAKKNVDVAKLMQQVDAEFSCES